MDTIMDDWQNNRRTFEEKTKHIFDKKILTDCEFSVGDNKIVCHKLLLAMASPVFEAMFYGYTPEPAGTIHITDIASDIFLQMIQYIYRFETNIGSDNNACLLYYAAKKYMLSFLEQECTDYLMKHIDSKNVITIYEFSKFHNEESLQKQCLMEIQVNTKSVLETIIDQCISEETLSTILDLNNLNITSELELINVVEYWAKGNLHENVVDEKEVMADKNEKEDDSSNKIVENQKENDSSYSPRKVSDKLVKKLRYLTLKSDEFIGGGLVNSELLSDEEKLAIVLRLMKPDFEPMNNGLCETTIARKPYKVKSMSVLDIQELSEARCDGSEWLTSVFKTKSLIDLLGVEIRLQKSDFEGEYLENLMVKVSYGNEKDHFAEGSLYGLVKYNDRAQVMLNVISSLKPDQEYAIHIFLCRPGIYPIGRHDSLSSSNTNTSHMIHFVSHSSWERSHPWNTTVISSIIYTDSIN